MPVLSLSLVTISLFFRCRRQSPEKRQALLKGTRRVVDKAREGTRALLPPGAPSISRVTATTSPPLSPNTHLGSSTEVREVHLKKAVFRSAFLGK